MTHHFIDNYSLAADKLVPRSESIFAELRSSSRSTSTCWNDIHGWRPMRWHLRKPEKKNYSLAIACMWETQYWHQSHLQIVVQHIRNNEMNKRWMLDIKRDFSSVSEFEMMIRQSVKQTKIFSLLMSECHLHFDLLFLVTVSCYPKLRQNNVFP